MEMSLVGLVHALQREGGRLTFPEPEFGSDPHLGSDQWNGRVERERERLGVEDDTTVEDVCLALATAVIELRVELEAKAHCPANRHQSSDDSLAVLSARLADRHEVLHLDDALGCQEAGDEDVGVREVELLGRSAGSGGRDTPKSAQVLVEDGCEDARRVKAPRAVPVDRAVGP